MFKKLIPFLKYGDFSDVYMEESSLVSLRLEDRKLQDVVQGRSSGLGIRCLDGSKTLYGHLDACHPVSQGLLDKEKHCVADLSRRLTRSLPLKRKKVICLNEQSQPSYSNIQINPVRIPLSQKAALLKRTEQAARVAPCVRQVKVSYGERIKSVVCFHSEGKVVQEQRIYVVLTVMVTAEKNGVLQTGYEAIGGLSGYELFNQSKPEKIAGIAAKRAVAKLKALPAPLGEMPVVISSQAGGTLIHEAIGHSLEADTVQDGSSPRFAGKIGNKVAHDKITVLDDPTLPGKRGSFVFDDEGSPAQRTVLVENGVLKTYLYDRVTARKHKRVSNGHGRRESYAHKPIPRMSNTFVAPGQDAPADILRSLDRGLFVTRMGGGQVNTATGDFVFEVGEGFWVESGTIKHMVRGANLLGNGPDVLQSIDLVGSDMGWSIGTCGKEGQGVPVSDGIPTLRVPKMVIGGAK